jgi:transitional endoplasmic reticulum ATPase
VRRRVSFSRPAPRRSMADEEEAGLESSSLTPKERKKLRQKAKKAEARASQEGGAQATCTGGLLAPEGPAPEASSPDAIFPAQQRGYDAISALLRACSPPHAEQLDKWCVRPPSGVLLSGPPGTGKTHLVRAAALAQGVPLVAFNGVGTMAVSAAAAAHVSSTNAAAQAPSTVASATDPFAMLAARRERRRTKVAAAGLHRHDAEDEVGSTGEESGARLRRAFARAERLARTASAACARPTPCVLFLDEIDVYCPKRDDAATAPEQRRCVAVLLTLLDGLRSRHGRVLAVAATNRPDAIDAALRRPGRLEWEVPLALPSRAEREAALTLSCAGIPRHPSVSIAEVSDACSGYAAADLVALVREALLCAARRCSHEVTAAQSAGDDEASNGSPGQSAACDATAPTDGRAGIAELRPVDFQQALSGSRAAVLRPSSSTMAPVEALKWDDIGGAADAKRSLQRAVEWPITRAERYAHFGISPPRGVLLHGPPGCAKTSLARAAAGAVGVSFLYLSGASLYSPFVGEAERAIRELFALGRACAPAILFLDELEAIVGSRASVEAGGGNAGSGGGGEAVQLRVLSTLLNEMDGIAPLAQVVVIGATNRPDMLDAALLRPGRFDEVVTVGLPDAIAREQILAIHVGSMPVSSNVDLKSIAQQCEGWSGAQLGALCREAGMQALREGLGRGILDGQLLASSSDAGSDEVEARHFHAALARVHSDAKS